MMDTIQIQPNINQTMDYKNRIKSECNYSNDKSQEKILNSNYSQDQMSPPIAILNSKFFLIKKLGNGSSGTVYLSYSREDPNRTLYAIKIIPLTLPNFDISNLANSCEVNFLSKMEHQNILKIHYHGIGPIQFQNGSVQQVYYIIMDYLDHGSLLSQINNNIGFGEDFGRLIFAQLLDGLEAIHNSNIVHRDIKLDNIMLTGNDYTLKYIDFGFATEKSNGFLDTFLGTPNYAAPELHLKRNYLGVSEDIFSLGVTLFILVTGHLPFLLALPNDPLYKYIFDIDYINYWRKRNIKVSPSFMELFDNLVAFDPSQRPTISEIRKSKWMQEINWELKDQLKNEFIKREKIHERNHMLNQMNNNFNNNKEKNVNNGNFNNRCNQVKNVDDILAKIKQRKKIDIVNDIKKQLFPNNFNNNEKTDKNNINIENKNENNLIQMNKINNNLTGFIHINANIKNINSLMVSLKGFFKNEGYNLTKKDLINSKMEISNGEIDVGLTFEKMHKITKIIFSIINGSKEDFANFRKIMKKINIKE